MIDHVGAASLVQLSLNASTESEAARFRPASPPAPPGQPDVVPARPRTDVALPPAGMTPPAGPAVRRAGAVPAGAGR